MIPEILSETGRIFFVILGHFLPFYPSNPKNQNFAKIKKLSGDIIILHMCTIMAVIWCMVPEIWSMTNRIFCHFGLFFALLPPWQPKKSNFWKNEKKPPADIILHRCTTHNNHIMNGSWDIKHNRQNFLSFWTICNFLSFWTLTTQKIKILKNWKITWRYHHFTHV